MKKIVNGNVVNIGKIELFDKALLGLAKSSKATSSTESTLDSSIDNDKVAKIIKLYNVFYKSMPYPLYAIEEDTKYAAIGSFIKRTVSGQETIMFIDNGLYIVIDIHNMTAIHIVNNSWAVENITEIKKDNVDIELYSGRETYEEFKWVLNKVVSMDKSANFYSAFMPDFIKACNNDPMIIRWELQNMMEFACIPNKISIADNTILDQNLGFEYTFDIFDSGSIKSSRVNTRWDVSSNGVKQCYVANSVKKYDYKLYKKDINSKDKLKLCEAEWASIVFCSLYRVKSICNMSEFPIYRGVISGNTAVYEVNGCIYACYSDGDKEIASNAIIYAVEGGWVYFRRITAVEGVYKVGIYKYSIKDRRVSTCSIRYLSNTDEIR